MQYLFLVYLWDFAFPLDFLKITFTICVNKKLEIALYFSSSFQIFFVCFMIMLQFFSNINDSMILFKKLNLSDFCFIHTQAVPFISSN